MLDIRGLFEFSESAVLLWTGRNGSSAAPADSTPACRRRHASPKLMWLARGVAFVRFGYDPLLAFSTEPHDRFGFIAGRSCEVFWPEPRAGEVKT
jgi:hypothetical protein